MLGVEVKKKKGEAHRERRNQAVSHIKLVVFCPLIWTKGFFLSPQSGLCYPFLCVISLQMYSCHFPFKLPLPKITEKGETELYPIAN